MNELVDDQVYQLMEAMPDPLILIRQDGTFAFANSRAEELLGWTPDELYGQTLEMILPLPCWQRYSDGLDTDGTEPGVLPVTGDLRLWGVRSSGREIPIDFTLTPLKTPTGVLLLAIIRDASAQTKLESELRSALSDVELLRDRLKAENLYLREEVKSAGGYDEFVGDSPLLKLLLQGIDQVARTDASVLITGETGTGKELVARAIHTHSDRNEAPLVKVDCAALPASLIESELFGHEPGAFTGAVTQRIGCFELADGGTIFLDEIGELPIQLQSKLLRVLQDGVFSRLGSSRMTKVDVRVISATNRNLKAAMEIGEFRPDLYFRLAVFPIEVPPLRERTHDIALLVWHFIARKQVRLGRQIKQIAAATMQRMTEYPWPGNVRELENVVERALILSTGTTLAVEPQLDLSGQCARCGEATSGTIDGVMHDHIVGVLESCHWQIKGVGGAAEQLGIHPSTLRYRMKRLGIRKPGPHPE